MLIAYMDESGTHDPTGLQKGAEVACIAGYVSTYKRWVKFQREWRDVLKKFGITSFHMSEYAHGIGGFVGWSKRKRDALAVELIEVIHEHTLFGLGGLISVRDYDTVLPPYIKAEVGHPYYFCMAVLMRTLAQFDHLIPEDKINFVFEQNLGFQGNAQQIFNGLRLHNPIHNRRLGNISFEPKGTLKPLEAADFVAYETRRYGADQFYGSSRPTRKSLEALSKEHNIIVGYYDADNLREHVKIRSRQLGIPLD